MATTMQMAKATDKNHAFADMGFYRRITEIWQLDYNMFGIPVFKCDWFDSKNGVKVDALGCILVNLDSIGHKSNHFI